jgi:hypothetical protein
MDFHVALALYETADNIEVLHSLTQKLLFKLHVHVDENPSGNTKLTKPKLIGLLKNAVGMLYPHSFSLLVLTLSRGKRQGL